MKKSELYYMAQIATINAACIAPERKLLILRELFEREDVELFCEKRDAEKAAEEE